ncbi:hypothetical protein [Longimicrobium sp.]|uniref:hypothetical protein n=1 Tax=Longimicrobium sp. TaxID=2029185 RepID=UPI002C0C8302|nr:hypothetical protein [Longimicrobium sp.]HSU12649.1 hypothetical protein [Longimicrobium sp.]
MLAALALLAPALASCSRAGGGSEARANPPADSARLDERCPRGDAGPPRCSVYPASLVELIARPERFDGKRVQVTGFVRIEFEGNAIYLSREDWEHGLYRNGLWINPPDSLRIRGAPAGYMIVEGTFRAANRGHMGLWSGAIVQVMRIDPWNATSAPPKIENARANGG